MEGVRIASKEEETMELSQMASKETKEIVGVHSEEGNSHGKSLKRIEGLQANIHGKILKRIHLTP